MSPDFRVVRVISDPVNPRLLKKVFSCKNVNLWMKACVKCWKCKQYSVFRLVHYQF